MAEVKISQLTAGTTLDGTELVPIVQGGATVKMTTQDIADLGGGVSNPSVIALSAVNGTTVNGLGGDTISRTLTIPANTYTGDGLLEIRYRISKSSASGSNYFIRVYVNTANTLSGATLISQNQVSPVQVFQQITRTMRINTNTLTAYSGGLQSDFQTHTSAPYSATFNINQQQFLIFTMQLANAGETGFVEFASAVKYI